MSQRSHGKHAGMDGEQRWAAQRRELAEALQALRAQGRLRQRPLIDSRGGSSVIVCRDGARRRVINWASNDYLGLSRQLKVRNGAARALRRYGPGATAARLLAGSPRCHRRLEERLASWVGAEDALLVTTGYQANLAALVALVYGTHDAAVILDRLCHASLYDGARLAGAQLLRFAHNDLADLARRLAQCRGARRRIVVVESVYSMDGDEAPLVEIAALCRAEGALLVVDEAHAIGVFGPAGRGLCAAHGVKPDLLTFTCSKALASQGGVIAGDAELIALVVNAGRAFIYTTAPVPAASGAAVAALDCLRERPGLPAEALAAAAEVRAALVAQGWQVPAGRSPIIPLLVGDEASALRLAEELFAAGHWAPAIRPPTVPPGQCRLRLTVTAGHTPRDRRRLIAALAAARARFAPAAGTPSPC
ncbi:MAG: 8-amino-7-oxononanoate synthase [Planctomycetes bacterium]|nr:8-amino-7-oxononanoate synthase [Planctomycetota bacterium]